MILRSVGVACALALVVAAAMPASAAATEPVANLHRSTTRQIDADVGAFMRRFGITGSAIAVVDRGQLVYTRAYGLRSRTPSRPVRIDTPFEIGSITKQFTAAALLQLQEAGKLNIDAPLATYLPDAPHAAEVTLKQLLSHTSGLPDYLNGPETDAVIDQLVSRPIGYPNLVARIRDQPLAFEPGSAWSYSNTGYLLAGRVIEVVSGEDYRAYLQRHILGPLGMRRTFTDADPVHPLGAASGYRHVEGRLDRAPYAHPDWTGAAGSLISTLSDLERWGRALRDGRVVSRADYETMTENTIATSGKETGYGLGLFVGSMFDQPRIGHTGGTQGFTSADEHFPRQDIRIIALTNSGDKNPEAGEALTNIVFARLRPDLIARADVPGADEPDGIDALVRASFRELQQGTAYPTFTPALSERLHDGPGAKLAAQFANYGDVTRAIFKKTDERKQQTWYQYVLVFSPGVRLDYAVRVENGQIAGVSFG